MQMMERMAAMRAAKGYVQDRRTRWKNDTRGLIKEADRVVRRGGVPKGWLMKNEKFRQPGHRQVSVLP